MHLIIIVEVVGLGVTDALVKVSNLLIEGIWSKDAADREKHLLILFIQLVTLTKD